MQSSKLALSSLLLRKKRLFQRSPRHAVLFSPSGYLGVKMEKKKNQHYVPQYYFKFFNDRQPFISILLVSKGTVIASSSVADQASKSYFYGDAEIESEVCIRSEEHTSELQSLMRTSYAVSCLKKKK